jgi:hypothetical protein
VGSIPTAGTNPYVDLRDSNSSLARAVACYRDGTYRTFLRLSDEEAVLSSSSSLRAKRCKRCARRRLLRSTPTLPPASHWRAILLRQRRLRLALDGVAARAARSVSEGIAALIFASPPGSASDAVAGAVDEDVRRGSGLHLLPGKRRFAASAAPASAVNPGSTICGACIAFRSPGGRHEARN